MSSLFNCCKGKNSGHIRDDDSSSSLQASTGFPVAAGPSTTAAAVTTTSLPKTVGEALRAYSLFSMTALEHGESINTTSQKKRPAVDSGRLENQKKSSRQQQQQHHLDTTAAEETSAPTTTAATTDDPQKKAAAKKFTMKEWDDAEFAKFLALADDEVKRLLPIALSSKTQKSVAKYFSDSSSMEDGMIQKESDLDFYLNQKFAELQKLLSEEGTGLGTIGLFQSSVKAKRDIFPDVIATGGAVDFLLARKDVGYLKSGVVCWENKVSWNFPGGSLTSRTEDYARLGRDVKLHELVGGSSVPSAADDVDNGTAAETNQDIFNDPDDRLPEDIPVLAHQDRDATIAAVVGAGATAAPIGQYEMKHDCFPPRQLVAYMLGFKTKFGVLSTGYRIDFCKLVTKTNETNGQKELELHVAGPFWAVNALNPTVVAKTVGKSRYYAEIGVQSYGREERMVIIGSRSNWSTDILSYKCLEGIVRFFLAATQLQDDTADEASGLQATGTVVVDSTDDLPSNCVADTTMSPNNADGALRYPRSYLTNQELPSFYRKYAGLEKIRLLSSPPEGPMTLAACDFMEYANICRNPKSPLAFKSKSDAGKYIAKMEENIEDWSQWDYFGRNVDDLSMIDPDWCIGLTRFGPLTLSELESDDPSPPQVVGQGRIGLAVRKTTPDLDIVCKILRQDGWSPDEHAIKVEELKSEMAIYHHLLELQGTAIPRFVYAGLLVDASHWVDPASGERHGLATTWEGDSLDKGSIKLSPQLMNDALDVLDQIHRCGVLHGDMELRNIVCNNNGSIKFVDFGNAHCKKDELEDGRSKNWERLCQAECDELKDLFRRR